MSQDNSTQSSDKCQFPGCERDTWAVNLCNAHYKQKRRGITLKPIHSTRRPSGTPPRIQYDEVPCPKPWLKGPCHVWRGSKDRDGYGQTRFNGRYVGVHRYVWELAKGKIGEGMEIDHQCQVKACCNVDHLREVTHQVNMTENIEGTGWQVNLAKTHCPKGHPYDEANTYYRPGTNYRDCRECRRLNR